MAAPLDIAASLSASGSATSGLRTDNTYRYGDVIVGPPGTGKPAPFWAWLVAAGLGLVAFAIWMVRR